MNQNYSIKIKMKKTTIAIMTICLMSFTLAFYPGEIEIFPNEMGIENLVYTIIGNSSPVGPLNIQINSTNITITFPQDMTPDNFDIIFLENKTTTVEKEVVKIEYRSSGGGSRTKYVDRNITVEIPKFYDRNITKTIELEKIIDNSETIIEKTGYKLWMIILGSILGLIVGFILYWLVYYFWFEEVEIR